MSDSVVKEKIESVSQDLIDTEQKKIIATATAKASTIAALPIPLVDVGGVVLIQINMVKKLAKSYGIEIKENGKLIVSTLLTSIIVKLISEAAGSIAVSTNIEKIFGESLIKASICGFFTTVIGEVYKQQFAMGESIDDINLDSFIDYFKSSISTDKFSIDNISNTIVDSALEKVGI